ncbi:MAG TPA: DUF3035 domain-containing protein, partial [Paracoccaceae bacterium]|nr:DUF3035 domain-containing protein [Paracoccaceae bacterium]
MMGWTSRACIGAALLALLSACSGSGDPQRQSILRAIGLRQPPPDEFLVVERRPLEMPGSFSDLPPPNPAGVNRVDPQPRAEVNALLIGTATPVVPQNPQNSALAASQNPNPAPDQLSPGEEALLVTMGAPGADPAIRERLTTEDAELREGGVRYAFRSILGQPTYDPYREEVLD